ncbi:MAG: hypothetical protein KatS3mg077_2102 [Candidatus Binatia bacterium]|nr:MAG: hypothetical protein KatS3mg077_2102 [Candidatus Binatia bacterium]
MRWLLVVALPLALLWCARGAPGLVVAERDFGELVEQSEFIVEGTVASIEEAPDATGIQRTLVTLNRLVLHKGAWPSPEFVLDIFGGTKNGLRAQVLDLPAFAVGERVMVFVRGNGREVFPVVGIHQGYFRIVPSEGGGQEVVRCDGLPVVAREQRNLRFAPRAARARAKGVSLEEFRRWIGDQLRQGSGGVR